MGIAFRQVAAPGAAMRHYELGGFELVVIANAVADKLGLKQLCSEWGQQARVCVHADSSLGWAIAKRTGCGKPRRISLDLLWEQEKNAHDIFDDYKIEGKSNPMEFVTKYVGPVTLDELGILMYSKWEFGRAGASLSIKR